MIKLLHPHASPASSKSKRSPRVRSAKRIQPERPVRVYSLLLPPTLPHDRK